MEKVLTNRYLLKKILKYAGINNEKRCEICDRVVKYQILTQTVKIKGYKNYCNLEACEKKYFCNKECLDYYKKNNDNTLCIRLLIAGLIISIVLIIIIPIIFNNKNL